MNKTNEHHLILIETMLEGCEEDGEKATEYVKHLIEENEKLKEDKKMLFDKTFGKLMKPKEENKKLNDEIKKLKEENAQLEFGIKCMRAEFHYHGDNANIDDYEAFNDFLKSEYPEQYEEMYEAFNIGEHLDSDADDDGDE